jgi:hypothetical protein
MSTNGAILHGIAPGRVVGSGEKCLSSDYSPQVGIAPGMLAGAPARTRDRWETAIQDGSELHGVTDVGRR